MGTMNGADEGREKQSAPATGSRAVVEIGDVSVTCRRPSGLVETIKWDELREVFIQTTAAGPFADDMLWVLVGETSGCVVPGQSDGVDKLLERLQALPEFDNQAVIQSSCSVENARFVCWRKNS